MRAVRVGGVREHLGETVAVQGWVHSVRDQKSVQFIILRDHTGLVQATVLKSPDSRSLNDLVSGLTTESTVKVVGRAQANPAVRLGGVEVLVESLDVTSTAERAVLPIDLWGDTETTIDKRLDWRFLDLRKPANRLVFEVSTTVEAAMREFLVAEGFLELHSPKIMGSPSESGAELFALPYFDRTAYLAQSPQFYKQMAMAAGLDRVFEIGPAFRADPSFTPRHATEFTSIDLEMSWIESHEDIMRLEERWLVHSIGAAARRHGAAVRERLGVEIQVPTVPFPRLSLTEVEAVLEELGHEPPPGSKKGDLDPEAERKLCQYVKGKYNHGFVFVTDYPVSLRPFYHMRHESAPSLTKSFDLLWEGLEITTGAQREHRYERLKAQALEAGLSLEPISFYLDFFRYGCPPHGGLGFGLARMLVAMLGLGNIREATFVHRGPTRLTP